MTKRINLDPRTGSLMAPGTLEPRRQRGTVYDFAVGATALLIGALLVAIVIGGGVWLALKVWTSALSMI